MRRIAWLCSTVLLLVPTAAFAIQLRWSSGTDTLTSTEAIRCTLLVNPSGEEQALPAEWTLTWVADGVSPVFVVPDPPMCTSETAHVFAIDHPGTAADSAANLLTAHFCSVSSGIGVAAVMILDLPQGIRAKFKVVALDPADPDSSSVIESNEVTSNGGNEGGYSPTVVHLTSDHSTTQLRVDVVGAGLSGIGGVSVWAPEIHAGIPLALVTASDSLVVATADVPIPLPTSDVFVWSAQGARPSGIIPADEVAAVAMPDEAYYRDPAFPLAYPKDFAFVNTPTPIGGVWQSLFHIYYIRSWRDGRPESTNEVTFGHAWSRDLVHWLQNVNAFPTSTTTTAWDHLHVWAPSIVRSGLTYVMFYTGVSSSSDQTIGYATTSVIDTIDAPGHWERQTAPVLSPQSTAWVSQAHPWNFRDPFVMADPANPGTRLLMFYCGAMSSDPAHLAVGVARSASGSLSNWTDLGFYPATDFAHTQAGRLESPHVFPDSIHHDPSQHLQATWRLMFTDGAWTDSSRAILFDSKIVGSPVTDLGSTSWSATPTPLYDYLHLTPDSPEYAHQGSEIDQIGGTYYWAGYDGADIRFRKVVCGVARRSSG
jgi:hypothetical protein